MVISSQLFDRILGVAHQKHDAERKSAVLPVGCRRASERRAATRIPFGQRAVICRDRGSAAGRWDTVVLQDISLSGVGLLSEVALDKSETFVVKVEDRDQQMIRIRCAVKRCERGGIGSASFLVGATFEQVIQRGEVQLHDEDDGPAWEEDFEMVPDLVAPESTIRTAGWAVGRAAASFFKALGPSQWRRKTDDYS